MAINATSDILPPIGLRTLSRSWHILTGEYPPQTGGVADYTRLLALALAAVGDRVHLWIPPGIEPPSPTAGATIRLLPDHFGPKSLLELSGLLRRTDSRATVLVQYVPHMYGMRGMNLPFAVWLRRFAPSPLWVMFHEVAFPMDRHFPIKHRVLGIVQHLMAGLVVRGADRSFVSVPRWQSTLRKCAPGCRRSTVAPVPSTVATSADPLAVDLLRRSLTADSNGRTLGHFGTWGATVAEMLEPVVVEIVGRSPDVSLVCIGRGSTEWRAGFVARHPTLAARTRASGSVSPDRVAEYLLACDLLVQPYPDGVSCRRTSAMAAIALGRPVVATFGPATEAIWSEARLVDLVSGAAPPEMVRACERLLNDVDLRASLGRRGADGYRTHFGIERTVEMLRESPP